MPRGHRAPFTSHTPRLRPSPTVGTGAGTTIGSSGPGFDDVFGAGGRKGNPDEDTEGTGGADDAAGEGKGEARKVLGMGRLVHREATSITDESDWVSTITSVDSKDHSDWLNAIARF